MSFSFCISLFISSCMSDKAAFVRGELLCVHRYQGHLTLYHSNSASCWQIINLHIYAATNRVSVGNTGLWYKLIQLYNSFTAIHVIMLELKNNKHNTSYHCTYLYIVNAVIFKLLLTSYLKRDLAKKNKKKQ